MEATQTLRQRILSADDIGHTTVEVPEWGVTVGVKGLTGAERARIINAAQRASGTLDFSRVYPELVIATAVDPETGEHLFEPTDRDALMQKSGTALDRIATAALEVSGMSEAATAEAKSGPEG